MSTTIVSGSTVMNDVNEFVSDSGTRYRIGNVFGNVGERAAGPQVFLVDQLEGATGAHFHRVPQFQFFVDGAGSFGKKPIRLVTMHYADPWSPYGPIESAENGIKYFTARAAADVGAFYMPGARKKKEGKSGRQVTAVLDAEPTAEGTWLIEPQPDGVACLDIWLAEGRTLPAHRLGGTARLALCLEGNLRSEEADFPPLSWISVDVDDLATITAGAGGARVVVMDFPHQPE
ncbi:hypothetical protein [Nocardia jinanensis]|uniref:Uncharacterized protein n=1 Tax=Nocardia jinanensis TaxID=382504 RepID=A0A917VTG3_9NOCA|nr:hypothetical protein [Nocardia jinanensis]GGL12466.1 hypothetical protein GCM10011588_28590 [Nocardia jinanensis]